IVQDLRVMLNEVNPYVNNFRYISDLPEENIKNLSILIRANIPGIDQRTHNAPTASQVAAIWIDGDVPSDVVQKRDIILRTQMNQLVRISEFSGCYDPLAYPLLFPCGEQGWSPLQIPYKNISETTIDNNESPDPDSTIQHRKFVSTMEYYA